MLYYISGLVPEGPMSKNKMLEIEIFKLFHVTKLTTCIFVQIKMANLYAKLVTIIPIELLFYQQKYYRKISNTGQRISISSKCDIDPSCVVIYKIMYKYCAHALVCLCVYFLILFLFVLRKLYQQMSPKN